MFRGSRLARSSTFLSGLLSQQMFSACMATDTPPQRPSLCKALKSPRVARVSLAMLCPVSRNGVLLSVSLSNRHHFFGLSFTQTRVNKLFLPVDTDLLFLRRLSSYLAWRFPAVPLHGWWLFVVLSVRNLYLFYLGIVAQIHNFF